VSIKAQILGNKNDVVADLIQRDGQAGLSVFTTPFLESKTSTRPFINPTYGAALNQNISFGGTPENIHDGGDAAGWTGAGVSGTWNFADTTAPQAGTNHVSITNADNLDTATFNDGTEIDMSGYTAITGQVRLVSFTDTVHSITIQFLNNGVNIGNSVLLDDYIDEALIGSYQSFVIPKADLGLESVTVDQMNIVINRTGGVKPTIYFDKMQIEQTGSPAKFSFVARKGTKFHAAQIVFSVADTGTGGTAYAYNQLGGLSSLTNGLVITIKQGGTTAFTANLKNNGDFIAAGAVIGNKIDDGTDTFYTLTVDFTETTEVVLGEDALDEMSIEVSDNLSGLLTFRAFARGHEEIINDS
jgi:hypothetical protein